MNRRHSCIALGLITLLTMVGNAPLPAQLPSPGKSRTPPAEQELKGPAYSNPIKAKWRVGATIKGGSKPAQYVLITLPIPNDWPEQRVSLLKEDIPENFGKVGYREIESGVRQMIVKIPIVQARQEVKVMVTMEVETSQIDRPDDVELSQFAKPKSSIREARDNLGISPHINHRQGKFRRFVSELVKQEESPWKQAEIIYDWVRDNIEHEDGGLENAIATWEQKKGNNEEKVFLFVAMCRSAKIPARIVFSRGMVYAEFMLVSPDQKKTFWFPCNINGVLEFGEFAEPRVILQKGDNVRVPEKEQRQKFVAEFLSCKGTSKPTVRFTRELVTDDD